MAAGEAVGTGEKDPDATLTFSIDWTDWLNGGTMGGSSYSVVSTSTGLSIDASTYTAAGVTTVLLSGGTAGLTYQIRNRVTKSTSTGAYAETDDRTLNIDVIER